MCVMTCVVRDPSIGTIENHMSLLCSIYLAFSPDTCLRAYFCMDQKLSEDLSEIEALVIVK